MAGADYAHCDGEPCLKPNGSTKVFYDADTDIPDGTVVLHAECAAAREAAADQCGYERAIEVLRDPERWLKWLLSGEAEPPRLAHAAQRAAAYLESVASSLVKGDSGPSQVDQEALEAASLVGDRLDRPPRDCAQNTPGSEQQRAPDLMANLRASLDRAKAQRGDSEQ